MYARFFTKALADLGVAPKELREPFARLFTQGMIRMDGDEDVEVQGQPGRPRGVLRPVGADALRLFHLFVGPPEDDVDWDDVGIEGSSRFLGRLWRLAVGEAPGTVVDREPTAGRRRAWTGPRHRLIQRVTDEYERWSYNTAVAAFMEFTNELYHYAAERGRGPPGDPRRRRRHPAAADGADGPPHHRRAVGAPPTAPTSTPSPGPWPTRP